MRNEATEAHTHTHDIQAHTRTSIRIYSTWDAHVFPHASRQIKISTGFHGPWQLTGGNTFRLQAPLGDPRACREHPHSEGMSWVIPQGQSSPPGSCWVFWVLHVGMVDIVPPPKNQSIPTHWSRKCALPRGPGIVRQPGMAGLASRGDELGVLPFTPWIARVKIFLKSLAFRKFSLW